MLHKYPRTPHLEGSRLQKGDADKDQIPFSSIKGAALTVEEKIDGANTGISFDAGGNLQLQSRGHFLQGGPREKQFDLLKSWASHYDAFLLDRLEDRYVMYGEWCFAKHTAFYDRLPHYFLEFDIYDRAEDAFLSTSHRRRLLDGLPIVSVPVLAQERFARLSDLQDLIQPSLFKSPDWRNALASAAERADVDPERALRETENTDLSEGLYLKLERDGRVIRRMKWVRSDFVQTILSSGSHWRDRPIIQNAIAPGVDLYQSVESVMLNAGPR